jgi:hypothetical protein
MYLPMFFISTNKKNKQSKFEKKMEGNEEKKFEFPNMSVRSCRKLFCG